jgi:hypothetical protein
MFFIKIAYWLGIGADALWAVGLLSPQVFGILTGRPDFNPDLQIRLIMGILWAVRQPIKRRFVILITAFVAFGLFIVAFIGFSKGNTSNIWILVKNTILIISMVTSYILARNMDKQDVVST